VTRGPEMEGEDREQAAIDDEVRFHLEGRVEELMAAGLAEEAARRKALEAFGDVERVRAELLAIDAASERRTRRREFLHGFLRDVRIGARRLRRSPAYTVVAVLTLMLGIGASVAMFTVLNAVVLRPLPYPGSERLVRIWPAENFNIALSREMATGLPSVAAATGISRWGLTLTGEGQAAVLTAGVVDVAYFDVFGVRPALGRVFTEEETEPSRSDVVLLAYGLWQTRFGGDPGVIGRRLAFSGYGHATREVIGVMPEGHNLQGDPADIWVPFSLVSGTPFASDSSWYVAEVVGRLTAGSTVERTSQEVRSLAVRLKSASPSRFDDETVAAASAISFLDSVVGDVRRLLWTLLAAVGLVLLIACGNLANLLLARTAGRRRELAVQAAMGASRGRLVRQQLAESTIIAVSGGALGVLLARVLLLVVGVAEVSGLPRTGDLALDGRILAFSFVVSLASLLLFGLLPALRAAREELRQDLTSGSRGAGLVHGAHRLNRLLVAAQIAMATVLTTGAGLMIGSFLRLKSVDAGVDASDVLAIQVQPPADRYSGQTYVQFYEDVTERLRQLPGVTGVGAIHLLPFTSGNWSFPYLAEGQAADPNVQLPSANFRMIMPGYFDAVDQPLISGRDIAASDGAALPAVMLINATFARTLWPDGSPVGRVIRLFGSMPHRVIGVVGDVHQRSLDRAPLPEMYVPAVQWSRGGAQMELVIEAPRADALAAAARDVITDLGPDVPIAKVRSLSSALGDSLARRRFIMQVLVAFGCLALLLGGVGVYGVMSHLVGARLPDFGVRMALGASSSDVMRGALSSGFTPALAGVAIGLGSAAFASRLLRAVLFGMEPVNLPTYALVVVILLAVAALASWLPAQRAARADPLSVLRSD